MAGRNCRVNMPLHEKMSDAVPDKKGNSPGQSLVPGFPIYEKLLNRDPRWALASGMTNVGRLKDLSDVLELIKVLDLPIDFALQLNPYVQSKFQDLWSKARKRYVLTWRNKWLTAEAKSIEEMISGLHSAAEQLDQMRRDGVVIEDNGAMADDYALLVTSDGKVAEKYGFVDESEYWDGADEEQPDDNQPTSTPSA